MSCISKDYDTLRGVSELAIGYSSGQHESHVPGLLKYLITKGKINTCLLLCMGVNNNWVLFWWTFLNNFGVVSPPFIHGSVPGHRKSILNYLHFNSYFLTSFLEYFRRFSLDSNFPVSFDRSKITYFNFPFVRKADNTTIPYDRCPKFWGHQSLMASELTWHVTAALVQLMSKRGVRLPLLQP